MEVRKLREIYQSKFGGGEPRVFRSPGRINIIGEHTDYNDGFVLPAAVDKEIYLLMLPNDSDQINIYSIDENESISLTLKDYSKSIPAWAKYPIGVVDQLLKLSKKIGGFNCVFGGDIPIGAGLSSSAALECATLFGLNECFDLGLKKDEIAKIAQRAENEFVGVNCGIMDQFASVFSKKNHALKLDCRDLTYQAYQLDLGDYSLMLVDSLVKHSLASSEYNVRRQECEEAVAAIATQFPHVKSLRDAEIDHLNSVKASLSKIIYTRAKYIIEEIERVNLACQAIEDKDLKTLGKLIYDTHYGLQYEFEISCKELDFLVDFTKGLPEVLGARMMGGGFGGCTINLIQSNFQDQFELSISKSYQDKFGIKPNIYQVQTANGSSEIKDLLLDNE